MVIRSNIALAAILGLVLGVVADIFFFNVERIPGLGCFFTPVALLVGLGLPVLVGAVAAAGRGSRGWMATPSGVWDGALAAGLAELVSRMISFCASISGFTGPRLLLPSVEHSARGVFAGIWELGWLVAALLVAALLGALGGFIYHVRR